VILGLLKYGRFEASAITVNSVYLTVYTVHQYRGQRRQLVDKVMKKKREKKKKTKMEERK